MKRVCNAWSARSALPLPVNYRAGNNRKNNGWTSTWLAAFKQDENFSQWSFFFESSTRRAFGSSVHTRVFHVVPLVAYTQSFASLWRFYFYFPKRTWRLFVRVLGWSLITMTYKSTESRLCSCTSPYKYRVSLYPDVCSRFDWLFAFKIWSSSASWGSSCRYRSAVSNFRKLTYETGIYKMSTVS